MDKCMHGGGSFVVKLMHTLGRSIDSKGVPVLVCWLLGHTFTPQDRSTSRMLPTKFGAPRSKSVSGILVSMAAINNAAREMFHIMYLLTCSRTTTLNGRDSVSVYRFCLPPRMKCFAGFFWMRQRSGLQEHSHWSLANKIWYKSNQCTTYDARRGHGHCLASHRQDSSSICIQTLYFSHCGLIGPIAPFRICLPVAARGWAPR
eukprot:6208958-Pleurochrysis_carterae.AAC.2